MPKKSLITDIHPAEIKKNALKSCTVCKGEGYDSSNWDNFPPVCYCVNAKGKDRYPTFAQEWIDKGVNPHA